jgi:molecular chaperone GrpE (heat shock protein)
MKDKIIEEMAKVLEGDCGECYTCKYFEHKGTNCTCLLGAEYLYNAGYRKIPENAVVLTREEHDELKGRAEEVFNEMTERMKAEVKIERKMGNRKVEQARKETAEKFARLVEFHSVSTRDENGREMFTISALGLKEILHEEFGITYDEIEKGFTEGDK